MRCPIGCFRRDDINRYNDVNNVKVQILGPNKMYFKELRKCYKPKTYNLKLLHVSTAAIKIENCEKK
jgi:hypothetical protein